ncbi:ABC transporter G family member 36 [Rhynchospora pubera]|uniref:ABC transporter G family member 36 n=1 Tax=Rhynchospora pubera TaxID=906938 RepID=A0AAV8FWP6_9POAL|nr:ABC transporter G family member 36 [Rhynchospora pubera]
MEKKGELQRMGSLRQQHENALSISKKQTLQAANDEEALMWASLERLPTYARMRTGILTLTEGEQREVDVNRLAFIERKALLDRLLRTAEEDHERFLMKLRDRIDRVGIDLPLVEVRFQNLKVDAEIYVGTRGLPTLFNSVINSLEPIGNAFRIIPSKKRQMRILDGISGIVRPRRMTLLLGPPGAGKTTLLQVLAGELDSGLKMSGEITYNGHGMDEFVAQRTAAYISQYDTHLGEMTVRETLAFSARCQGAGTRYDMITELARREKEANIQPDPDIDVFMKAIGAGGKKDGIVTDYVLKILGLENCAETQVGNQMIRGISGGEKKRLTTGEMIVGPAQVFLMDEISTGLDSSTTYKMVNCIRHYNHIFGTTTLISLLQPSPETFLLFDDIILISEGHIVYQGPRDFVLHFFHSMGFQCPLRKALADFLQEVTSLKDQQQYWAGKATYRYVPVREFADAFRSFHIGKAIEEELAVPFDKEKSHPAALTTSRYGVSRMELFKACFDRQLLLMKRNMLIYIFKACELALLTVVAMTVFFRTKMHHRSVPDGAVYMGALFLACVTVMFNGLAELGMTIFNLPVFYKQRQNRMLKQFLLLIAVNQMASALFRLIAGIGRDLTTAMTYAYGKGQPTISEEALRDKHTYLTGEGSSLPPTDIKYSVDMPQKMKAQGETADRLVLLKGLSGSFRPGVLTALMGVTGAGKTTLMDVLSGRKTGGYIEGTIKVSGYPKNQETFARVSAYCEQIDIHSPFVTVYESLLFSAWLRLPAEVDAETRKTFIEEVMELVELTSLRGSIVGTAGVNGLSTEQRKRLTIAVELVANPSIIFMDEPTSGLDARAAAIVMRTAVKGVKKMSDSYNPATWMMEVTESSQEEALRVDFHQIYKDSVLYQRNMAIVKKLSAPPASCTELHFPTKYSQPFLMQLLVCMWKQYLSYWRNPSYNVIRFVFTCVIALFFGTVFWRKGQKWSCRILGPLVPLGSIYDLGHSSFGLGWVLIVGEFWIGPGVGSFQVGIEIPYNLIQSVIFSFIVYILCDYKWTASKFVWFWFLMFLTFLYHTLYGMVSVAMSPNFHIAAVVASGFYSLWNIFSGFLIPRPRIPIWWRWFYWTCPIAWTLYGLLVSQYGDVEDVLDIGMTVKQFLRSYYGFRHSFLPVVAVVIMTFTVFFALLFGYALKKLNWQKR